MKNNILLIFIISFSFKCFSQEKIEWNEVYSDNGIIYTQSDNQIFTGIVQQKNKKGHINSEEVYQKGILFKRIYYYNIDYKQIACNETIFDTITHKKLKYLKYSSDGKRYWETIFDENEKKKSFSLFENGIETIHKEYKDNKRNGRWFCINEDGTINEFEYKNGKKVKSSTKQ